MVEPISQSEAIQRLSAIVDTMETDPMGFPTRCEDLLAEVVKGLGYEMFMDSYIKVKKLYTEVMMPSLLEQLLKDKS